MADIVTPNVGFVEPVDASPMPDVNTYLNNNWTKVESLGSAPVVTSVPAINNLSHNPGDRVFVANGNADPAGIYVCIGVDPVWGAYWRPVTARYGPFRRPGVNTNSVIFDPSLYQINDNLDPFQVRLTRHGRIQFRGSIRTVSGTFKTIDDVGGGYYTPITKPLPDFLQPGYNYSSLSEQGEPQLLTAPFPVNSSPIVQQTSQCYFEAPSKCILYRIVSKPNATISALYFSGAEYDLGIMGLA